MASANATSPFDSSAGGLPKMFHRFPNLPAEIRVRIWQFAYSVIPYTHVYRFRLGLEFIGYPEASKTGEVPYFQAFLVPLEEVGYLTRECRNLRKVNTESRHESERYFDGYLRLNQTEEGGTTDFCPPINIPWKENENVFCFVGLEQDDLEVLNETSMALIAQVFSTITSLGFDIDRSLEDGFTHYDDPAPFDPASLIIRFPKIRKVVLVSDLLMTETELDDIHNDNRSRYRLESWIDWVGRVPEHIIGFRCKRTRIVTQDEHLKVLSIFDRVMVRAEDTYPESAKLFRGLAYGMILRTERDLKFLLEPDEILENDSSSDETSGEFNDALNVEVGDGDGDA